MIRGAWVLAAVLACASAAGAAERLRHRHPRPDELTPSPPPEAPAHEPAAHDLTPPVKPVVLPAPWDIFLKRSIFARGGRPAAIPGAPGGGEGGVDSRLAVRGVVREDSQFSAFVEDTASHQTVRVRPGDKLGSGKVKAINLDSVVFESPLHTTHVEVGQTLMGTPAPAAAPRPAGGPAPAPPPGQGPLPGPPPGVPPDMAAKMMMARQAISSQRLEMDAPGLTK